MEQTLFEFISEKAYTQDKSLAKIAKEIKVSYPTVLNIKHRAPSRMTYYKLAKCFDIDVRELQQYPITK